RVPVHRAALDGLVDRALQRAVLAARGLGVSVANRGLEPAEIGLDRGCVPAVLESLALGAQDPLLLRVNVGHRWKRRTIAALSVPSPGGEPPGGPRPEPPGDVIGIPDASFGEEYGGFVRPEPAAAERDGEIQVEAGGGRIARNTAIFSLGTGLSRVLGLAREIVAAGFFGTSGPA